MSGEVYGEYEASPGGRLDAGTETRVGLPLRSSTECVAPAGQPLAALHVGVCAAISHWWFRYEPPNAAWKKLSRIAYFGWPASCRYL